MEVALAVGLAAFSAGSYRPWAPVDEAAHFGYVESLAVSHRLPVLTTDRLSPRVEAISEGRYPRPPRLTPGPSYEAFQPPLYYLVATPAFLAAGASYTDKVRALRYLDVALMLSAAALLCLLARELFPSRWVATLPLAGAVLLWPGLVIRSVTISNDALVMPAALLFLLLTARAYSAPRLGRVALAAVAFALCLLTKLTLAYLGLALIPLMFHTPRSTRVVASRVAVAAAITAAMLAPWLASNLDRYGALTANRIAQRQQSHWDGPDKRVASVGAIAARLPGLALWTLPQEWVEPAARVPVAHPDRQPATHLGKAVGAAIEAVIAVLALAGLIIYRRERRVALLAFPVLGATLLLVIATAASGWDVLLSRYLYSAVPPLALLAGAAWARLAGSSRVALGLPLALTGATIVMWVALIGTYL